MTDQSNVAVAVPATKPASVAAPAQEIETPAESVEEFEARRAKRYEGLGVVESPVAPRALAQRVFQWRTTKGQQLRNRGK